MARSTIVLGQIFTILSATSVPTWVLAADAAPAAAPVAAQAPAASPAAPASAPAASERTGPLAVAGKVVSVDGKVLIRQDDGKGQAIDLKAGDTVKEGDVLNTSSNGKAKLLLEDKTILDIGPSALFKVQKFKANGGGDRQVDLAMAYGTVRASVSKPIAPAGKFQIRTRTATMGVRGTEFIVQTDIDTRNKNDKKDPGKGPAQGAPQATKITVVQGKVEVAAAAPSGSDLRKLASVPKGPAVMLTAGTQLTAAADAPVSKPITLNAGELTALTASTKLVDTTFQKAVNLDLAQSDGGNKGGNNNGGGAGVDSAAGAATRTAIAQAITTSPTAPTTMTTSQFIGGFNPTAPPKVTAPTLVGGFSTIHVVVK